MNNSGQVYLFACPVDQHDFDGLVTEIRSNWMFPDEKVIPVRILATKAGQRGLVFNKIVRVQRSTAAPAKPLGDAGPPRESVESLMRAIQDNNERMWARITDAMQARAQVAVPQRDPFEMMTALMTAMGPVLAAVAGRPTPEAVNPMAGIEGTLRLLETAKSLLPGGDSSNDGDGDSMLGVVKEGIRALPAVLAATQRAPAAPAAPAPRRVLTGAAVRLPPRAAPPFNPADALRAVPPNPADVLRAAQANPPPIPAAAPVPPPVIVQSSGENPVLLQLSNQLGELATLVAQNGPDNADPVQIAEMVMQQIPEDADEQISDLVFDVQVMQKLAVLQPRVNEHPEWWQRFVAAMRAQYIEGGEDE
jgi:hypothetical protein